MIFNSYLDPPPPPHTHTHKLCFWRLYCCGAVGMCGVYYFQVVHQYVCPSADSNFVFCLSFPILHVDVDEMLLLEKN